MRAVRFLAGAGVGGLVLAAADASTQMVSEGHTGNTAATQYITHKAMRLLGAWADINLERDTANAIQLQQEFLEGLLRDNATTEYGRRYGFGSEIATVDQFTRRHPLTTFPHYKEYLTRAAEQGELSLLTAEPISRIGVTSGTSGTPATLPVVPSQRSIFFLQGISIVFDRIAQNFPSFQSSMQRTLKIFFTTTPRTTPSGLPIGPNSSAPADSKRLLDLYTTPADAYQVLTEPEALYLYALFALKDRNLGCIESNFVSAVYNFFEGTVSAR